MRRLVASVSVGVVLLAATPCGAQETRGGRIEVTAQAGGSVAPGSPFSAPVGGRVAWAFKDRWDLALDGVWYTAHVAPAPVWPESGADGAALLTTSFALVPDFGAPQTPAIAIDLGVGAVGTHPVSVVDPAIRSFSSRPALALTGGLTIRARISEDFRLDFHLRDIVYDQAQESMHVGGGVDPSGPDGRLNPDTWYGPSVAMNRVELLVGFTFGR
jgi:hypothetical protein